VAAMGAYHLLHDIEPQPGAPWFRGMQRLKNLAIALWGNADAGIAHVEVYGRALPSSTERQGASLRHRVPGVVHQIHEHTAEGRRVEGDRRARVQGIKGV